MDTPEPSDADAPDAPAPPRAEPIRIVLGGVPDDAHRHDVVVEKLRKGALVVRSRHGLRPTEKLLIEGLPAKPPATLLVGLDGEGVVAIAAHHLYGTATKVTWWHIDAFQAARVRRSLAANGALDAPAGQATPDDDAADDEADDARDESADEQADDESDERDEADEADAVDEADAAPPPAPKAPAGPVVNPVEVVVGPDLPGVVVPAEAAPVPGGPFDLIALPFPRGSEAIFAREVIEEAHAGLVPGGRLLAAIDDPDAEWGKRVLKDIFGNATVALDGRTVGRKRHLGVVLGGRRKKAKAEVRDHRHSIRAAKLRARGESEGVSLTLESRPGVFGNVALDQGTRALAEAFDVGEADAVLDLGCGYGPLGILAAQLAPRGRAVLIDANARAVACARRNAPANGASNVEVRLLADLEGLEEGVYDLALANPPYFSNFRIARAFVEGAFQALKPGGRLWLVAKAASRHQELMEQAGFTAITSHTAPRGHGVLRGVKP